MNNISFEEKVAYAKQQLQNGVNPKFVFSQVWKFSDGFAKVRLGNKYNFINTDNKILRDDLWFDGVDDFRNGFAVVYLRDRGWNFITPDGNFLHDDLWFDSVGEFHDGFASVQLKDRGWTFIKPDGNFLRDDLWFDNVDHFSEGFAAVGLKGKGWNFIKRDGNFLRDDLWFDDVEEFHNGFVKVYLDGKKCFLDTKGNLYDEDNNLINKVNENKRRVVRLTESQLRNTIKRVVAQCLNERRIR